MGIGLGLGFRVFIVTFRAGFDGFLFISLALAVAESIVDFDRSGSMSISRWNLTGHNDPPEKKNEKVSPIHRLTAICGRSNAGGTVYPVPPKSTLYLGGGHDDRL